MNAVRRVSYAWALGIAVPAAGVAHLAAPALPGVPVAALLTLVLAQVPLPSRPEAPLTQRHPRSELNRHLERRRREAD